MSLAPEQIRSKDKLIRKRAFIKGQLTSFKRVLENPETPADVDTVKIYMERLEKSFEPLAEISDELAELDPAADHTQEHIEMEAEYIRLLAKGRKCSRELARPNTATVNTENDIPESPSPFNIPHSFTRLPEQALPKFDGKYENWLSFKDDFESSIGSRTDLSHTQKLKYLRSCLSGEPERLVKRFGTTNESYNEAMKLLKETFEQKAKILERYISAIFNIPVMQRESASDLCSLVNTMQLHLSALKALDQPVDQWSSLLVFIVLNKLDKTTRKEWKRAQRGNEVPSYEKLINFLREAVIALDDTPSGQPGKEERLNNTMKGRQRRGNDQAGKGIARTQCLATAAGKNCPACKGSPHPLLRCQLFKSLSPKERHDIAVKAILCLNCLRPNHNTKDCGLNYACLVCKRKHHTWLHYADPTNTPIAASSSSQARLEVPRASQSITLVATLPSKNILSAAVVKVTNATGAQNLYRVLLDTCPNSNFMTDRLARTLGLPMQKCSLPISGVDNAGSTTNYLVKATISSRLNTFSRTLSFLTVKDITGLVPDEKICRSSLNIPSNKPLADPQFDQPGEIDLLIASGTTLASFCMGQIKLSRPHEPDLYLQNTRFGWIIGGSVPDDNTRDPTPNERQCFLTNLDQTMRRFWEIEDASKTHNEYTKEGCEEHFRNNTIRDTDGRYTVALPFNDRLSELGETRAMATRRLISLERRLRKDPTLQKQYNDVLQEYIDLGHMTKINVQPESGGFYLPHHAVIKETSLTTKVRVVFDGSAKSSSGLSLNDTLIVGPTIQDDIFSLLLRFRKHNYVLNGDIEKMYRQFWVRPPDRHYQRILFRDSDGRIATYELNTITFGLASAPYMAIRCLHHLADDEGERYPRAAKALKSDMYVDDLLTGAQTTEEALELRNEINALLERGKFNMRQWASNEPMLLQGLHINCVNLKLQSKDDHTIKTLGLHWNSERDQIVYTVQLPPPNGRATKRNILSEIARIFDPLGWDDPIPLYIHSKWLNYTTHLSNLNNLSFSRKIATSASDDLQLHGFCDASEVAYGACINIRASDSSKNTTTTLLCAKSRVAPLKNKTCSQKKQPENNVSVTIPRLELCAAQLLARLYTTVCQATAINPSKVVFWSDSTIALHWIRTAPQQLLPFVANRVSDIQTRTEAKDWRHVRSADNPADLISRGQTPEEFVRPSLWKHGPTWLRAEEEQWPHLGLPSLEKLPEMRKIKCLVTPIHWDLMERYSSITKLRRIIAYCLRFKTRLKGSLTCDELQNANNIIFRAIQSSCFAAELKDLQENHCVEKRSKLAPLSPFIDQNGLIRVGGRLRHATIPFAEKHAVILPRNHHITNLLINYEHLRNYHSGNQATLYALRRKYWILDGRSQVRRIIRNCIRCTRVNPPLTNCKMGDLPKVRVTEVRPFLNVGVDYCGPFFIKEKKVRNRGRVKVYIAVFVYLSVKAVHMELVSDLTTEGFIAALKRFIARRGLCKNIYSDNGTTFVGTKNDYQEIMQLLRSEKHNSAISYQLADYGIQWHFMPPHSPNFGGVWEAAVKSFKRHLKRVVGDQLFTFEELNTFIIEVEAIMNSRPLTPISNDPNDLLVLTPGHFLIGNSLTSAPEIDLQEIKQNRLSSWQHIQKVRQDFWKRWHKEYLTDLNIRHKWTHGTHEIKEGTLVLIKEDNVPPLRWPMGRIIETVSGPDGIIRVVRVKTSRRTFIRNIRRLSPLSIDIE